MNEYKGSTDLCTAVEKRIAQMVEAQGIIDVLREESLLDEIVKIFNEGNFSGWNATPDDQKAKLINFATTMAKDERYKEYIIGNSDPDAIETMSNKIIDDIVRQKRSADMSLYKQYQMDAEFKAYFRQTIMRMAQTVQAAPEETILHHIGFTQSAENISEY